MALWLHLIDVFRKLGREEIRSTRTEKVLSLWHVFLFLWIVDVAAIYFRSVLLLGGSFQAVIRNDNNMLQRAAGVDLFCFQVDYLRVPQAVLPTTELVFETTASCPRAPCSAVCIRLRFLKWNKEKGRPATQFGIVALSNVNSNETNGRKLSSRYPLNLHIIVCFNVSAWAINPCTRAWKSQQIYRVTTAPL